MNCQTDSVPGIAERGNLTALPEGGFVLAGGVGALDQALYPDESGKAPRLEWLTDDEEARVIEIALTAPAAAEWLEKGSVYTSRLVWVRARDSGSTGGLHGTGECQAHDRPRRGSTRFHG